MAKETKLLELEAYTEKFLKTNKDFHYNFEPDLGDLPSSSGSLLLDSYINGGLPAGCHTFCGANGAGKTSAGLEFMRQRFLAFPECRGIYINAEGRLSEHMKKRSGITFVTDPKEWVDGTCFVFTTNIYDTATDYLRGLIKNNPQGKKLFIIIDSMHGLLPKGDLGKTSSDAAKVAGGATLASDFLRRTSIPISKSGHVCVMNSQVRSHIAASAYAQADPNNQTSTSASNAQLHFSNWILEFRKPLKGDLILKDPDSSKVTPENPPVGHYARLFLAKADNDNRMMEVKYPIKHNRKDGRSIWKEREIIDLLLSWGFIEKKGSWYNFDDDIKADLEKMKIEKNSFQGMGALYSALEEDEKLTTFLGQFVIDNILNALH